MIINYCSNEYRFILNKLEDRIKHHYWRIKKMFKIISWIYYILFGEIRIKCDCCKDFVVDEWVSIKNKNNMCIKVCHKCYCAHASLNKPMNEIYEQLEAQSFRRFL